MKTASYYKKTNLKFYSCFNLIEYRNCLEQKGNSSNFKNIYSLICLILSKHRLFLHFDKF